MTGPQKESKGQYYNTAIRRTTIPSSGKFLKPAQLHANAYVLYYIIILISVLHYIWDNNLFQRFQLSAKMRERVNQLRKRVERLLMNQHVLGKLCCKKVI